MNRKEIIDLIKKTRKQYEKAQALENQLFDLFIHDGIDLESYPGTFINHDNLSISIMCHLHYGESDIYEIEELLKKYKIGE